MKLKSVIKLSVDKKERDIKKRDIFRKELKQLMKWKVKVPLQFYT
ncbi:MAG: hypothetical protein NUV65_03990 [Candidatus Roizmanbacteria bacterium]|nr:hypothetical protein [Candidatus Roizmanbacteria bacterium]